MTPLFSLEAVLADAPSAEAFCEALRGGFARLALPVSMHERVSSMRHEAESFFLLPEDEKKAVGDFKFVGNTYAGFRLDEITRSEFLELHRNGAGALVPTPPPESAGLEPVAVTLVDELHAISHALLRCIARHMALPESAFTCMLDGCAAGALGAEEVLHSVLRVCYYTGTASDDRAVGDGAGADGAAGASAPDAASDADSPGAADGGASAREQEVVFDAHTDSSLLTLSLLNPRTPGLQLLDASARAQHEEYMRAPAHAWHAVEAEPGVGAMQLLVHVGDFLSTLTRGYFPSAVHRVVRPRARCAPRLSMPFLVRPRADHVVDTEVHEPGVPDEDAKLLRVRGITCAAMRRLFDKRGRKLHLRKLELERREAERRAAGQAFREKLRSRRTAQAARLAAAARGAETGSAPASARHGSESDDTDSASDSGWSSDARADNAGEENGGSPR